jgi:hypothetical protein
MMNNHRLRITDWRRFAIALTIVAGTIGMLLYGITGGDAKLTSAAYAASGATAQAATIAGRQVGEVLVDGTVVLRIRSAAGGYSAYRRAQVVADRLNQLTGDSLQPEDITTGIVNGQEVVLAGGQILVTADTTHARINGTTPSVLAKQWADNVRVAFGGETLAVTAAEPTSEKIVPIISVGQGTRIGGAQVTGPKNRVSEVVAVAQIEGTFQSAVRIRVLVPVSSENVIQKISRVPQTSVTALVDIKI